MKFENIPKRNAHKKFGYIKDLEAFNSFVEKYEIVGVKWSQPQSISASYFLRLLQNGSSEKPRGYGIHSVNENDESSNELREFYSILLDHGALWKTKNGNVICTAMPYGDEKSISEGFQKMITRFQYPDTIKMVFLNDKYRFRPNGDYMLLIYCDLSWEEYKDNYSEEELRRKALLHSSMGVLRFQKTKGQYNRDRFVNEYAKKRAQGVCQLCDQPAPFMNVKGEPFLETHHIIPLSGGGADSVDNTIALCPNCHRKMHVLNLEEDVEKLKKRAYIDLNLCE